MMRKDPNSNIHIDDCRFLIAFNCLILSTKIEVAYTQYILLSLQYALGVSVQI